MNGYNFTERVRKVLAMAREQAAHLHHEYVAPEHMLLGLIAEGEGVASTVFENLSVDPEQVRQRLLEVIPVAAESTATGPDLPYTSRAKKCLEFAMKEARDLSHSYVGTEHLLLGLTAGPTRELARATLKDMGLTHDRALRGVATALSAYTYARETLTFSGLSAPIRAALEDIRARLVRLESSRG